MSAPFRLREYEAKGFEKEGAMNEVCIQDSKTRELRKNLEWWDVVVVALILFGGAIYNSTMAFFITPAGAYDQNLVFTAADNWYAMGTIIVELTVAYVYLHFRRFDFSQWIYRITLKGTLAAVGLFALISVGMDLVTILSEGPAQAFAYVGSGGWRYVLEEIDVSVVLFSLLNGFYEEIFFLGVVAAVAKDKMIPVFAFSVFIRFSFHTYQGLPSAMGIGLIIGCVFYYLYLKNGKNLYPFMLAHTFADIFGVGFLSLL